MPIPEFLYLGGGVATFLAFGLTLARGQYQTPDFVHSEEPKGANARGIERASFGSPGRSGAFPRLS